MQGEYVALNAEQAAIAEKYGITTAFYIEVEHGISRQMTTRYIRAGKLNAVMNGYVQRKKGDCRLLKWYIFKDEKYDVFIKDHAKKGDTVC